MILKIKPSLECPICTDRYTVDGHLQPNILKCGHTFCRKCIQEISKMETNVIKCSFCSGITPIGPLGVYALPVNRLLVDILCDMNIQGSLEVDLCFNCDENPAEKICFGCDPIGYKMCEPCCFTEHNRPFDPIRSHKPLNIDEVMSTPGNFCSKHKQLLTHYSEKTGIYACKECLEEKLTTDKEFLPIDAAIQAFKQRLLPVTENLEGYLKRLRVAKRKMKKIQGQLEQNEVQAMQEIQTKFFSYQKMFQKQQMTLLSNMKSEVSNICIYMHTCVAKYIYVTRT